MRVIDRRAFLPMGADAGPVALVFPGLSLLEIEVVAAGQVTVRCPGCGASQLFTLPADGSTLPAFRHTSGRCRIGLRIEAALAIDEATARREPG